MDGEVESRLREAYEKRVATLHILNEILEVAREQGWGEAQLEAGREQIDAVGEERRLCKAYGVGSKGGLQRTWGWLALEKGYEVTIQKAAKESLGTSIQPSNLALVEAKGAAVKAGCRAYIGFQAVVVNAERIESLETIKKYVQKEVVCLRFFPPAFWYPSLSLSVEEMKGAVVGEYGLIEAPPNLPHLCFLLNYQVKYSNGAYQLASTKFSGSTTDIIVAPQSPPPHTVHVLAVTSLEGLRVVDGVVHHVSPGNFELTGVGIPSFIGWHAEVARDRDVYNLTLSTQSVTYIPLSPNGEKLGVYVDETMIVSSVVERSVSARAGMAPYIGYRIVLLDGCLIYATSDIAAACGSRPTFTLGLVPAELSIYASPTFSGAVSCLGKGAHPMSTLPFPPRSIKVPPYFVASIYPPNEQLRCTCYDKDIAVALPVGGTLHIHYRAELRSVVEQLLASLRPGGDAVEILKQHAGQEGKLFEQLATQQADELDQRKAMEKERERVQREAEEKLAEAQRKLEEAKKKEQEEQEAMRRLEEKERATRAKMEAKEKERKKREAEETERKNKEKEKEAKLEQERKAKIEQEKRKAAEAEKEREEAEQKEQEKKKKEAKKQEAEKKRKETEERRRKKDEERKARLEQETKKGADGSFDKALQRQQENDSSPTEAKPAAPEVVVTPPPTGLPPNPAASPPPAKAPPPKKQLDIPKRAPAPSEVTLAVTIQRAKGLDVEGRRPDSYVGIEIGNSSKRTRYQKQQLAPVWNECFKFPMPALPKAAKLTVYNVDPFAMQDIIGVGEVIIDEVGEEERVWAVPIKSPVGKPAGTVMVAAATEKELPPVRQRGVSSVSASFYSVGTSPEGWSGKAPPEVWDRVEAYYAVHTPHLMHEVPKVISSNQAILHQLLQTYGKEPKFPPNYIPKAERAGASAAIGALCATAVVSLWEQTLAGGVYELVSEESVARRLVEGDQLQAYLPIVADKPVSPATPESSRQHSLRGSRQQSEQLVEEEDALPLTRTSKHAANEEHSPVPTPPPAPSPAPPSAQPRKAQDQKPPVAAPPLHPDTPERYSRQHTGTEAARDVTPKALNESRDTHETHEEHETSTVLFVIPAKTEGGEEVCITGTGEGLLVLTEDYSKVLWEGPCSVMEREEGRVELGEGLVTLLVRKRERKELELSVVGKGGLYVKVPKVKAKPPKMPKPPVGSDVYDLVVECEGGVNRGALQRAIARDLGQDPSTVEVLREVPLAPDKWGVRAAVISRRQRLAEDGRGVAVVTHGPTLVKKGENFAKPKGEKSKAVEELIKGVEGRGGGGKKKRDPVEVMKRKMREGVVPQPQPPPPPPPSLPPPPPPPLDDSSFASPRLGGVQGIKKSRRLYRTIQEEASRTEDSSVQAALYLLSAPLSLSGGAAVLDAILVLSGEASGPLHLNPPTYLSTTSNPPRALVHSGPRGVVDTPLTALMTSLRRIAAAFHNVSE